MSNVPLFVLAAPMLCILLRSSLWTLHSTLSSRSGRSDRDSDVSLSRSLFDDPKPAIQQALAIRFALPQIVLVLLALTTYHVQIITRLSSGYPLWYWWLASLILEDHETSIVGRKFSTAGVITRWMVIYAIIQGGFFASFLPPA